MGKVRDHILNEPPACSHADGHEWKLTGTSALEVIANGWRTHYACTRCGDTRSHAQCLGPPRGETYGAPLR